MEHSLVINTIENLHLQIFQIFHFGVCAGKMLYGVSGLGCACGNFKIEPLRARGNNSRYAHWWYVCSMLLHKQYVTLHLCWCLCVWAWYFVSILLTSGEVFMYHTKSWLGANLQHYLCMSICYIYLVCVHGCMYFYVAKYIHLYMCINMSEHLHAYLDVCMFLCL